MRRIAVSPRPHWQELVEAKGLHFHSLDDQPYWNEGAYYSFTAAEIDHIEQATNALNKMCLQAVAHVVSKDLFDLFALPRVHADFVARSWERDERTIYGRFDFSYDGVNAPKLLEYNADTPTSLLEAAVIQWFWLKDVLPTADQFNSIHERLIEAWAPIKEATRAAVYFTSLRGNLEDYMTVNYLRDTAIQAGLPTAYLPIEDIGWNRRLGMFVDRGERAIETIFKLYPWEWMLREAFGPHLPEAGTRWLEPPWKMLLSNKAMLAVLCDLFPDSPYLLRTEYEPFGENYVRKPTQGREGANIAIVRDGTTVLETDGPYGTEPCVYQELKPLPEFDGHRAVIGSWLVNGYACGMGIREDDGLVTNNTSQFVPHVFEK